MGIGENKGPAQLTEKISRKKIKFTPYSQEAMLPVSKCSGYVVV